MCAMLTFLRILLFLESFSFIGGYRNDRNLNGCCQYPFYNKFLKYNHRKVRKPKAPTCRRRYAAYGHIDLRESRSPSVFRDLTTTEIDCLLRFMYYRTDLNLTRADKATINSNYIYTAELFLPPKEFVLNHLDKGYPQPPREAHVIIYRGGIPKPDVIELIVGPLPHPVSYRPVPYRPTSIPFIDRPITSKEDITEKLNRFVDSIAGKMLYELYGGRLIDCNDRCLVFASVNQVSSVISGVRRRRVFHSLSQYAEFFWLRPIDFGVLTDQDINNNYVILKVWFDGRFFENLMEAVNYYLKHRHIIKRVPFPKIKTNTPLTLNPRGKPPFHVPLKDPTQVSPDGKRYNIIDRHVSYTYWEFDIGNSLFNGPRINDVRYKGERIAYEISLQELANYYASYKPQVYTLRYLDSIYTIGESSKYLVAGIDCPNDATFISSSFKLEDSDKPVYNAHAFCVFEHNTALPLRRHHGFEHYLHHFYEGVANVVLIVRTSPTVGNYDYIIDFIFYQNGVIEIKTTPTGVIAGDWHNMKNPYGFEINENLYGPLHQHLFHYKIDLDIKGTRNRFETLDIERDVIHNDVHVNPYESIVQERFVKRLKRTEKQGAYKYDFNYPKYSTIVNNNRKDRFGNSPGYKIVNEGMTKLLRHSRKDTISWAQYQLAVTKYKDCEPKSSSIYLHSKNPVFHFQQFIDDNENIVDEDVVAWVSSGFHHIVHKEDLPITHTPGMSKSIFLTPFNYFDESPGISAGNSLRIDAIDVNKRTQLKINRYGTSSEIDCIPPKYNYENVLKNNPCFVVQCLEPQ